MEVAVWVFIVLVPVAGVVVPVPPDAIVRFPVSRAKFAVTVLTVSATVSVAVVVAPVRFATVPVTDSVQFTK